MGTVPLVPPQYAQVANYARTHMYIPFDVQPSSPANALAWIQGLEARLGTNIEVLGLGLPNGMGDPTSTLARWASCPQAKVWASPATPNGTSGSGTLAALNAGTYDSLISATAAAFAALPGGGAANGGHGEHWTRFMWEYDFSNYAWGIGVNGNTLQNQADGFDRYTGLMVAGGYLGKIILNAGTDPRPLYNLLAHPERVHALGIDFYNTNGGVSNQFNWDVAWSTKRKSVLQAVIDFCRAKGLRLMFPECGIEVKSDAWHTRPPNTNFWNNFLGMINDNPDVCDAPGPFNLEMGGAAGATTSDLAMTYCGRAGTQPSSVVSLGSYHNTSTTAAWTWTDSPLRPDIPEFQANFIAGSWQKLDPPVLPPSTLDLTGGLNVAYDNETDLFA